MAFDQTVADYGLALAIAIVMIPFLLGLIWLGRRDARQMTHEFMTYLREDAGKQTEVLVASANAMRQMVESMRDNDKLAEKRHLDLMLSIQKIQDQLKERR